MAKSGMTIELDEKDYQRLRLLLSNLSETDQGKIVQAALKSGMQTIINTGKQNLAARNQSVSGNLKRSFGIVINKKGGYALGGFKRPKGAHAHLVDRGTDKRWTRKGAYRGSVSKGTPNKGSKFYTDAVDSQGPQALDRLMDAIYQEMDKIMKRNK